VSVIKGKDGSHLEVFHTNCFRTAAGEFELPAAGKFWNFARYYYQKYLLELDFNIFK